MQNLLVHAICLLLATTLLGGCSSLQVQETWRSSSVTAENKFRKVLVVNINLDENVRTMYEDIVAAEMKDSGLDAVAGHKHVTITEKYKRSDIAAAVKATGCDAVLTTRELHVGNQQVSQEGQGSVLYGEGLLPSSWDLMVASLQINLYSAVTEQLVWSATIKTSNDDNKFILSRDMGQLLIKLLRRDGMI